MGGATRKARAISSVVRPQISRSVSETSAGVAAVLDAMQKVALAAAQTREVADLVSTASGDLKTRAGELDQQSREFIGRIRQAQNG